VIYLGDSINYVGENIGSMILGKNNHNNGNFKRKFGPKDSMYYGEFCWWYVWVIVSFVSNFLTSVCMGYGLFYLYGNKWDANWEFQSVVLECVGIFVLFKLLSYFMYGDMFSLYFIEK
jgi:hypothetical protein